jgi:hypothetical protein
MDLTMLTGSLARLTRMSALALALGLISTPPAAAQAGRLFLSVPTGSQLVIVTYNGVRSNTWADEAIANDATESRTQSTSLVYSPILNIFGRCGGPGISVPYMDLLSYTRPGNVVGQDGNGLGDIAFTFDVNIFGAPAMTTEQFKSFVPDDYMGIHLTLGTPTGQYDKDAVTNIGGNRYTFKALLNYSVTWNAGKDWVDFYPSVRFFGDNDDFKGGTTFSQDPIYGLEAHYSRTILPRTWISGGVIASAGGQSRVEDLVAGDTQRTLKLAVGGGFSTWQGGVGILTYNGTVARTDNAPRANTFMLQFIQRF